MKYCSKLPLIFKIIFSLIIEIIRGHLDETNSTVASTILDRWHQHVRSFKKVMPKDYRRVLEAIATAEEHGQDVEEAVMAAAKG